MPAGGIVKAVGKVVAIVSLGVVAACVPSAALKEAIPDAIAALAITSAFLIQLMFLLATAFNPAKLKVKQIEDIGAELLSQQTRAATLFGAYALAIVLLLAVKISYGVNPQLIDADPWSWLSIVNRGLAGIAGLVCGYCAVGTLRLTRALRSMQQLRHLIFIRDAKDQEEAERQAKAARVAYVPPPVGTGSYGRRIEQAVE